MSNRAVVTFTASVFERDHLFVLTLLDNLRRHLRAGDQRIAMSDVLAVREHQHFAERRGFPRINIKKIDIYRVAFRDAILPSASLDDCVSHNLLSGEKKPRKLTQNPVFDKRKAMTRK